MIWDRDIIMVLLNRLIEKIFGLKLNSLTDKILLPAVFMSIFTLAALFFSINYSIKYAFEHYILPYQVDKVIESEKERIENTLSEGIFLGKYISEYSPLKEFIREENTQSTHSKQNELWEFLRHTKRYYDLNNVYFVNAKTLDYYTQNGFLNRLDINNPSNDWYLKTINSNKTCSMNIDSAMTGNLNLWVDCVVQDNGGVLGAAGFGIDVSEAIRHLKHIDIGLGTKAMLIDKDNVVKLTNLSREYVNKPLQDSGLFSSISAEKILNSLKNDVSHLYYVDASQEERYLVISSLNILDWRLVVDFSTAYYQKWYDLLIYSVIAISFVLLFLSQLQGYLLIQKHIIKPIENVGLEMERYTPSRGFDPKQFEQESDEIHILVQRFYAMDKLIQKSHTFLDAMNKSLKVEVNNRTQDLRNTVSQLERSNHELAAAKEAALVALKARSEFISSVSHELRTPLNAIINFSDIIIEDFEEMLKDEGLQKDTKDYLARIHKNSLHLLSLINDILEFSKLEASKVELELECIDISELTKQVYRDYKPSKETLEKIAYTIDTKEEHLVSFVDKKRLTQILYNLLSNAIKFTEEGFVEIVCFQENGDPIIEVRDSGKGIPKEQQVRIFEPFSQVNKNDKGTGLGLNITHRLCAQMDIELQLTSDVGKGTTFRLTLPRCDKKHTQ